MFQLNVKEGFSKYLENLISRDFLAFSCEDQDDVQRMFQCLRTEQKLDVHIIWTKGVRSLHFASPSISEISRYGFNHFLLELVDGPLPILKYLCRTYRIHDVPIGTDHTRSVAESVPHKFNTFFTRKFAFAFVQPV